MDAVQIIIYSEDPNFEPAVYTMPLDWAIQNLSVIIVEYLIGQDCVEPTDLGLLKDKSPFLLHCQDQMLAKMMVIVNEDSLSPRIQEILEHNPYYKSERALHNAFVKWKETIGQYTAGPAGPIKWLK